MSAHAGPPALGPEARDTPPPASLRVPWFRGPALGLSGSGLGLVRSGLPDKGEGVATHAGKLSPTMPGNCAPVPENKAGPLARQSRSVTGTRLNLARPPRRHETAGSPIHR